jgi:cytochrome c oxidase subunit 2
MALGLAGVIGLSAGTQVLGAAPKKPPAKKPANNAASVAQGKSLVAASGCTGCHKIGEKGGNSGPDLSHVGAKDKPADIAAKIKNPKAKNPNSIMPASTRSDKEIAAMAAYLASLK